MVTEPGRTMVLVGAILQLFVGGFLGLLGFISMIMVGLIRNFNPSDPTLPLMEGLTIYLILGALIGYILMILWFFFMARPSKFRKALLVTGGIGILLCGVVPGLLVFIGGMKASKQEA